MDVPLFQQLTVPLALFFVALIIRGVFAFLETTITALRLFKIKEMAHNAKRYENIFHTLEKNPHRILITILIISSFADVICAAMATNIMEAVFNHFNLSSNWGFTLGVGFAGIMIILFGEILPKNLARSKSERLFQSLIWLINAAYYGLYPLVTLLIYFSDSIINRISDKQNSEGKGEWVSSEQEIRFLIDYIHDKGIMEKEKPKCYATFSI
jgi:Putative Mg2+ and Co2+ transporter CorB